MSDRHPCPVPGCGVTGLPADTLLCEEHAKTMIVTEGDPYAKTYHMAYLFSEPGVSPLCADKPRAINLKRELWTLRLEAVTCPKCRKRAEALGARTTYDLKAPEVATR